jgi:hypothetical protein
VLLLGFNRPDLLADNLEVIRGVQARDLYISLDGPRSSSPTDAERCRDVRRLAEAVDWTTVKVNAREANLGCGPAVSSGISWALEQTERLIIIEDDCLPDPSFFAFCDELLERYADDERVMQIAGCNLGAAQERYLGGSYAFTSFSPVWGWATWRRAWEHYEFRMDSWPRFAESGLFDGLPISKRFRGLMRYEWNRVHAHGDQWDHQWQYAVMRNSAFSVSPSRNLVINVGFRPDATNIAEPDYVYSNLPHESMDFPLRHPPEVARNPSVEGVFETIYRKKMSGPIRLYRRLVRNERIRKAVRRVTQTVRTRPT